MCDQDIVVLWYRTVLHQYINIIGAFCIEYSSLFASRLAHYIFALNSFFFLSILILLLVLPLCDSLLLLPLFFYFPLLGMIFECFHYLLHFYYHLHMALQIYHLTYVFSNAHEHNVYITCGLSAMIFSAAYI